VRLSAEIAPAVPTIHGDAPLLENALVDLLLNACDACSNGGHVRLAVTADTAVVCFRVIDDGDGISAKDAVNATGPLFAAAPSGARAGLGLAIANEIVRSHRGTLALTPAFPRGTQASVEIPLVNSTASAA
jgi:signal transduction histidine kinase